MTTTEISSEPLSDNEMADRVDALAKAVDDRYGGLRVTFNHGGVGRTGGSMSVGEALSMLSTLLRDRRAAGGEAKRWLVEETLPSGVIRWECMEHENQARAWAASATGDCKISPLYLHPSNSGVAVRALDESAFSIRNQMLGAMSREDNDGMISVPAFYLRKAIEAIDALHPSPDTGKSQDEN